MITLLQEIIISYCLVQLILGPIVVYMFGINKDWTGLCYVTLNPIQLYKKTRLNRFGSWCVAIFLWIVFTPWAISYWIYKAFTVGK